MGVRALIFTFMQYFDHSCYQRSHYTTYRCRFILTWSNIYRTPLSLLEEDSNGFDTSITSQGIVIFSKEKAGAATHNKNSNNSTGLFFVILGFPSSLNRRVWPKDFRFVYIEG